MKKYFNTIILIIQRKLDENQDQENLNEESASKLKKKNTFCFWYQHQGARTKQPPFKNQNFCITFYTGMNHRRKAQSGKHQNCLVKKLETLKTITF